MTGPPELSVPEGPPSSSDDRSTGTFCSERSALITWWQVNRNFLFRKGRPYHVMTGSPEFFVPKSPPSSCDDRSTRISSFRKVHPHHVMTGSPEFSVPKSPPSSCDDRSTGISSFRKVHPHHVMTGPPKFLFPKVRPQVMRGPPEIFVPKGPPSSHDDRSMLRLCQTISQHVGLIFKICSLFFAEWSVCGIDGTLLSTKAVCEFINVEESHVIAQALSNNILASVGPIFKIRILFFAEWSVCGNYLMLMFTRGVFETSILSWLRHPPAWRKVANFQPWAQWEVLCRQQNTPALNILSDLQID